MNVDFFTINKEANEGEILKKILEILKFRNELKILCGTRYQKIGRNIVSLITFMNDENTSAFAWISNGERLVERRRSLPFCIKCNILLEDYKCPKCNKDFSTDKKDILWKESGKNKSEKKVEGKEIKFIEFTIKRDARHVIENG